MKSPKVQSQKGFSKASRTVTRQSALKDTNLGLGHTVFVISSKLAPHDIPALNLDLEVSEVFEITDAMLEETPADLLLREQEARAAEAHSALSAKHEAESVATPAQSKPQYSSSR